MVISERYKFILIMWACGLLGIISILPIIPQLIAMQNQPTQLPILQIQAVAMLQSGALVLGAIFLGYVFSSKVNLSSPVLQAFIEKKPLHVQFRPQIIPALIGGILGGVFIVFFTNMLQSYLPAEFIEAAKKLTLPWYSRIFYGGVVEELLMRWGLMSFFAWAFYRLLQRNGGIVRNFNYLLAILITSLIFGLGHLPMAHALSPNLTPQLIAYILIGNASFGIIAGVLYWKFGLECAILSHMLAHITMLVFA